MEGIEVTEFLGETETPYGMPAAIGDNSVAIRMLFLQQLGFTQLDNDIIHFRCCMAIVGKAVNIVDMRALIGTGDLWSVTIKVAKISLLNDPVCFFRVPVAIDLAGRIAPFKTDIETTSLFKFAIAGLYAAPKIGTRTVEPRINTWRLHKYVGETIVVLRLLVSLLLTYVSHFLST